MLLAAVAAAVGLAPVAGARDAAQLSLNVTFTETGAISVTDPTGAPVGTMSGSPTVIPAGYYTLLLSGPGGCTELPYFELKGPGTNVLNDMELGEFSSSLVVNLQPNATYTWRDEASPDAVYTFATSAQVLGTKPPPQVSPKAVGPTSTASSHDLVGSNELRGTLVVTVPPSGRPVVRLGGRLVSKLAAGRYTVRVVDRSGTRGIGLVRTTRRAVVLTTAEFTGTRSRTVTLADGSWRLRTTPTGPIVALDVS